MSTEPAAQQAERTAPPAARRIPHERTFHGDTFTDDYAWLADPGDPQTIAFLEAENAYTEAVTAGQAGLREQGAGHPGGLDRDGHELSRRPVTGSMPGARFLAGGRNRGRR